MEIDKNFPKLSLSKIRFLIQLTINISVGVTTEELQDKIEEFKEEGCTLFK